VYGECTENWRKTAVFSSFVDGPEVGEIKRSLSEERHQKEWGTGGARSKEYCEYCPDLDFAVEPVIDSMSHRALFR
jgi:hypothetical protein